MMDTFRLATYNLESLDDSAGDDAFAERIDLLRLQLSRLDADVLCLQEVNAQRRYGKQNRGFRALETLIADSPYAGFHRASAPVDRPRDRHNLTLLSRWPLRDIASVRHDLVPPPSTSGRLPRGHREPAARPGTPLNGTGRSCPPRWSCPMAGRCTS